eukprot:snap_masked-scaffold_3-processed-gene-1.25-mRNA-1 protein AED:1.00 eAED:1.00 QI:0/0/0/0/1/1/2/0/71
MKNPTAKVFTNVLPFSTEEVYFHLNILELNLSASETKYRGEEARGEGDYIVVFSLARSGEALGGRSIYRAI